MPTHSGRQPTTKADLSSPGPLAVTYKTVGSLKPDPRNARTHSKRQVEQIIASIRAFGFTNPILVDPEGGLIAGHGRLLAAKSIGMARCRPSNSLASPTPRKEPCAWPTTRSRLVPVGTWTC